MNDVPGSFVVALPLWTVIDSIAHKPRGFPEGIVTCGSKTHGNTLPLFSREMAAKMWGAALEEPGQKLIPFEIQGWREFVKLARYYKLVWVSHVAYNPGPGLDLPAERYIHLDTFIAKCEPSDP